MKHNGKEIYWSQFADSFEPKQKYVVGEEVIQSVKSEILKEWDFGRVLELGCGTGLYTETITDNATKVIATDYSQEMINKAIQRRYDLEGVCFETADARSLKYEKSSFNTVFMANLIHVTGDPEQILKECNRVLAEDGIVLITSFAFHEMAWIDKMKMTAKYLKTFGLPPKETNKVKLTQEGLELMLQKNGFEIIKSRVLGSSTKALYITALKVVSICDNENLCHEKSYNLN